MPGASFAIAVEAVQGAGEGVNRQALGPPTRDYVALFIIFTVWALVTIWLDRRDGGA